MSDMNKAFEIFVDARRKIERYNALPKAKEYNFAYQEILKARRGRISLVDENGTVNEGVLSTIERGLLAFDMGRQMDASFRDRLRTKLNDEFTNNTVKRVQQHTIMSREIETILPDTKALFENLADDANGLSARGDHFSVGATKIMNFIFPELFVIADQWVLKGLSITNLLDFEEYWSIMKTCRRALEDWQENHGNLKSLTDLDNQPTTSTRVFDKCAFIMGKADNVPKSEKCPLCNSPLVSHKAGRTGETYRGCSNYPACKYNERSY